MRSNGVAAGWVPVARETFEYNLVPWCGRLDAPWLRACAREHPVDPRSQVLIPERIYRALTNGHHIGERVSQRQLRQMGYPQIAETKEALRHGRVPTVGRKPAPAEVVSPLPARPKAVPPRQPMGQPALVAAA